MLLMQMLERACLKAKERMAVLIPGINFAASQMQGNVGGNGPNQS